MRSNDDPDGHPVRTFTEEARRKQIIECAIETIAGIGYGRASLAEVAKRAGVSKGVISYHFAGKNELIERVIEHIYTKAAHEVVLRLEELTSPAEILSTYIRANVEFVGRHPREVAVIGDIVTNFRWPDGSLRYGPHTDEPLIQPLRELFEAGQRAGEFRSFSTETMARVLRAAIDSVGGQMLMIPGFDSDQYTDELITLFDRATRRTTS